MTILSVSGFTPGETVRTYAMAQVSPYAQRHELPPSSIPSIENVAGSSGAVAVNVPDRIEQCCFGLGSGRIVQVLSSTTRGFPS